MSATTRGTVHEFETESGKEIGEFRTAESPIDSFCLSPDWSKYATVSKDRHTLTVWDRQKNSPLRSWNDSQEVVGTARFSPDNENFGLAFTASPSRLVVLGTGAQLLEAAPRRSGWIMSIAANSMLVNGDAPEEIVVFDSSSGKRMRTLKGINRQAVAAAMSPDGRFVAGGGYDGDLFLWDTRDELPQKLSEVGRGLPMTISWSGDSRMFAVSRVARDDANHLPTLEHVVEVYRQIDGIPRLFWTFDQVHHAGQAHFLSGDQIMVVEDYDSKTNKKNLIRLRIPTAAAHQPE